MSEKEEAVGNIIKLFMKLTIEQALIISDLLTITKDMTEELTKNKVSVEYQDMFVKVVQAFQRFQNTRELKDKICTEALKMDLRDENNES